MMMDIPFCILFSGERIQKFPQESDSRTSRNISRLLSVSSRDSLKSQNPEEHYKQHMECSSTKLVCECWQIPRASIRIETSFTKFTPSLLAFRLDHSRAAEPFHRRRITSGRDSVAQ